MITAEEARKIKTNKTSLLYFEMVKILLNNRIKKISKTNRNYIKVNDSFLLKILYRKHLDKKVINMFKCLNFDLKYDNKKILQIGW